MLFRSLVTTDSAKITFTDAKTDGSEDYLTSSSDAINFKMPAYDVYITTGYYTVDRTTYVKAGSEIKLTGKTADSWSSMTYDTDKVFWAQADANGDVVFTEKMPAFAVTTSSDHYRYTLDGVTKYTEDSNGGEKIGTSGITSYVSVVDKNGEAQKYDSNAFAAWASADGEGAKYISTTDLATVVVDTNDYALSTGVRKLTVDLSGVTTITEFGAAVEVKVDGAAVPAKGTSGGNEKKFETWVTDGSTKCEVTITVSNANSFKYAGEVYAGTNPDKSSVTLTWKLTADDNTINDEVIEPNT